MKKLTDLIDIKRIPNNWTVETLPGVTQVQLWDYLEKNHEESAGYGQDYHSTDQASTYKIFLLKEEDYFEIPGENYKVTTLMVDYNANTTYCNEGYEDAKEFAEMDGRVETN